jgi:hypothetical protein
LISTFLLALGCKEEVIRVGPITLQEDTIWRGTVVVEGDVYVPPGVVLRIMPGTKVKFRRIGKGSGKNLFGVDSPYYPQAEIIVRGRIVAEGSQDRPILFTSAERDAGPADWGAINLLGSRDNVLRHCKVLCAYNAVHGHSAEAVVEYCEFSRNGVAISFKKEYEFPEFPWFGQEAVLVARYNFIYKNKGGIGFRATRVLIAHNTIRDNKFFGLWPKEDCRGEVSYNDVRGSRKNIFLYQLRGLKIQFNNIYDSRQYNVAVAEGQDWDVRLTQNWWGTINKRRIERLIYDAADDPGVARVIYEPYLRRKVREAGV